MSSRRLIEFFAAAALAFVCLSAMERGASAAHRSIAQQRGAASEPLGSPSAGPALDTDFLLLPAYDFERSAQGGATRVGDTLELKLSSISLPAGVSPSELTLAVPPGNSSLDDQGFAIEKAASAANGSTANAADLTAVVVPLRPGMLTLPSLAVVVSGSVPKAVARTNPFQIEVASAIQANDPKPKEPAPARPPLTIDFPTWVLVVAGILGFLVLAFLFYAAYRWSKNHRPELPLRREGPPLPEDEAALLALAELEKSGWGRTGGDHKKYSFRVSEILKTYIGVRYRFDAPECTTRELFASLDELPSGFPQRAELRALFDGLDRVKFTDYLPQTGELSHFVAEARRFVQSTRKAPPVTPRPQ